MKKLCILSLSIAIIALIIPAFSMFNISKMQVLDNEVSQNSSSNLYTLVSQLSVEEYVSEKSEDTDSVDVFFHETEEVKTMSMLDYITCVVLAEIPASFSEETIKAQVVIAHTYTLNIMEREAQNPTDSLQGADISTNYQTHQAYCSVEEYEQLQGVNFEENYSKISSCVEEVFAQILTYEDEPIIATFHAMSSGTTESAENVWGAEVEYLVAIDSEGDTLSPTYESSLQLTKEEVENLIYKQYPDVVFTDTPQTWFEIISLTDSGYVDELMLLNLTLSGQDVRSLFSLRSADFTVSYEDGIFEFNVLGYGHGVGLSQYGADYLARQGYSYEEILAHYYPNTNLVEI